MSAAEDLRFQEWVERARAVRTIDAAYELGFHPLPRRGGAVKKLGGCTACGVSGSLNPARADRFCVFISGPKEGGFACRKCGITGGNAIDLRMRSLGETFLEACEKLTGETPPRGRDERSEAERQAARERLEAKRRENEAAREQAEAAAREEGRKRACWARDVWDKTRGNAGTPVEAYLRHRGFRHFDGLNLADCGFAPSLKLKNEDGLVLHEGPAMVWRVIRPGNAFDAVHRTWIDPVQCGVAGTKGRPRVIDPDTGEAVATKKTLGIKEGGVIRLVRGLGADGAPPRRLFLAEGIETLGAMREAMIAARHPKLAGAAFWAACDLYNIAAVKVPEPIEEVILLGDGDSDRKTIDQVFWAHMKANCRREARFFTPVFAEAGRDFSDMWMEGA